MIRRTKWFKRFRRKGLARVGRTERRSGRALAFEHCEPRVVLSTNAAVGEFTLTGGMVGEGGLISLDAGPGSVLSNDSVISAEMWTGATRDSNGIAAPALQYHHDSVDHFTWHTTVAGAVDGTTLKLHANAWFGSNVRLIESPLENLQHPEGGQIALGHSGVDAARLAAKSSDVAADKLARRPEAAAALKQGVGSQAATRVEGLRGRAVIFEVANATNRENVAGTLTGLARRVALHETSADLALLDAAHVGKVAATQQDGRGDKGFAQRPASATSVRSDRNQEDAALFAALAARTPTLSAQPRRDVSAGDGLTPDEPGASAADGREIALAAREAALQGWAANSSAPISDPDSAALVTRGRKVLALAVVLTLGSTPLGKMLRRRGDNVPAEQRPRRRAARLWGLR